MKRTQLLHLLLCLSILSVYLPAPQGTPMNSVPVAHAQRVAKQVDIVFVVDTSGSMDEEFTTLCDFMDTLVSDLKTKGIEVHSSILGITEPRACFSEFVSAVIPRAISNHPEDWGPAVRDVAAGYTWLPGYTRLIIPMSDEAPEDGGDNPEGMPGICEDPGSDRDAITVAIDAAQANSVRVAPVLGIGMGQCTITLAQDLADATGGQVFFTTTPREDLAEGIASLIEAVAEDRDGDGIPDDEDPFPDDPCRPDPQAVCLPPQVCGKTNTPHWDDDKDGQMDEELQNGLDEDGDGLIDEDVGGINCPYPDQDCGVNSHRGFDDDADGRIDEETDDGVDNDGDHFIDEDVTCPCPPEQDLGVNDTPGVDDDHDFQEDEEADDGLDNDADRCVDEDVGTQVVLPGFVLQITSPRPGDSYYYGGAVLVTARLLNDSQKVLGAQVGGLVLIQNSWPLSFRLYDNGHYGDAVADDGIYSADIALFGPQQMPTGIYTLLAQAEKTIDGEILTADDTTTFSIMGPYVGAPTVWLDVEQPATHLIPDDTIGLRASVTFPDGQEYPGSLVTVHVFQPDGTLQGVTLQSVGGSEWQGSYTLSQPGTHILDARARPPAFTGFADGYASTEVQVFFSREPLAISPVGLPAEFKMLDTVPLTVTVTVEGQPMSNAIVTALVHPDVNQEWSLTPLGDGHYVGQLFVDPELYGVHTEYTVSYRASAPLYLEGAFDTSFKVIHEETATLAQAIDDFVVRTEGHLDKIGSNAKQVAKDGDYFRSQIGLEPWRTAIAIAFDLIPLAKGIAKSQGWFKDYFQFEDHLRDQIRSHWPGYEMFRSVVHQNDLDGRSYQGWLTRFTHGFLGRFGWAEGDVLRPKYVAEGVTSRALTFLVAKTAKGTVDYTTDFVVDDFIPIVLEEGAKESLTSVLEGHDSALEEVVYGQIIRPVIAADQSTIRDFGQHVRSHLDRISLEDAQQKELIRDLHLRSQANGTLQEDTWYQNGELFLAAEARRLNDKPARAILRSIVKALVMDAAFFAVGALLDGPGLLLLAAKTATNIAWDVFEGQRRLSEDQQMYNFAVSSIWTVLETEQIVLNNSAAGLLQVALDMTPKIPRGRITGIEEKVRGYIVMGGRMAYRVDKEAFARVTIRNNGAPGYFGVKAHYELEDPEHRLTFGLFGRNHAYWLDGMMVEEGGDTTGPHRWVYLDRNDEKTVRIYFKGANGHDMEPPYGGDIVYVLVASTDQGLYYANTRTDKYEPRFEEMNTTTRRAIGVACLAQTTEPTVIPNPITGQVFGVNDSLEYVIRLTARNPFPFPIAATVSQALPLGITVTDPVSGTIADGVINWGQVIQPHESYSLEYRAVATGSPDQPVEVPAPELRFYSASADHQLVFHDYPMSLMPRVPLLVSGQKPAPGAQVVAVDVTNLSASPQSGELILEALDLEGTPVGSSALPISIPGSEKQSVELPIPVGLKLNTEYILILTRNYGGVRDEVFFAVYRTPSVRPTLPPIAPLPPPSQPMTWLYLLLAAGGLLVAALAFYFYSQRAPAPRQPPVLPPAPASLQLRRGQAHPRRLELRGTVTTIGRGRQNHVTVEDPLVSRRHCQIRRQGGEFILEDLGSTNGTFLNGQRVTRKRLHSNDVVRVGQTELVFRQLSMGQPS